MMVLTRGTTHAQFEFSHLDEFVFGDDYAFVDS
jgi:hypothetical protein